uniref:FAD:protein FMN transferase n=1 Tax=candidate division WOR-3 bacterium TaxID=2052148 RepID=A0A7C4X9J3_UNCW3
MNKALPFLLFLFITSCGQREFHYQNFIVGGPCEIKFYISDKKTGEKIINEIQNELLRIDSLLNFFSPVSLVSEINQKKKARLEPDIKELFLLCDSISHLSDGFFDISIAPLMQVWGFYEKTARIPDKYEIEKAKKRVDYTRILFRGDSIIIPQDMTIDLGGIAQGFAADRVAKIIKDYRVNSAIINIAGEVCVIGNSIKNRPWRVGIKNPRGEGIIESLDLDSGAVSTSGDYERYFIIQKIRYPHIINPKTGYPAREFVSVTIFAPSAAFADGIATAVSAMGAKRGKEFLDSLKIRGIIYYESEDGLKRLESKYL